MYKLKICKETPDAVSMTLFITRPYMNKFNFIQRLMNANNGKTLELMIDKFFELYKEYPEKYKDIFDVMIDNINSGN